LFINRILEHCDKKEGRIKVEDKRGREKGRGVAVGLFFDRFPENLIENAYVPPLQAGLRSDTE
jgi:hypothetical protein